MYKTLFERMLNSQNDWSSFNKNYAFLIWSACYKVTNVFIPLEINFADENIPPESNESIKIYLQLIFLTENVNNVEKNKI